MGEELPVIAEDLGFITNEVRELRDRLRFPGMKIILFGFGGCDSRSLDLPHNYPVHCLAYTGTHDNDTVVGWFQSKAGEGNTRSEEEITAERSFALKYLNCKAEDIHRGMIRSVWSSVAAVTIAPVQDLLGLSNAARMNMPGTVAGNWTWRCEPGMLNIQVAEELLDLTQLYGREVRGHRT
jgi:4-alpha-glucanotransferase